MDCEESALLAGFFFVIFTIVFAIWSYNMWGPASDTSVALRNGYVQKVVTVNKTDTETIWTKP